MKKCGIILTTRKENYIMAEKSMWLIFEMSPKYTFDIDKMINIFEKLIEKLNLTYNYEYMIFSKTYWKKSWMKDDELLKHKGSISEIDKDTLLQIKDECNDFFWECKHKRKFVIQISFSSCINCEDNTVNHYSININRYDEMYSNEFIKELAQIVKEGTGANDEILVKTDYKLHLNENETLYVEFNDFE